MVLLLQNYLNILQAFNEFKMGIYEQALLYYYKPGLNTTYVTQFNFTNWKPGYSNFTNHYFDLQHVPEVMKSVNSDTFSFSLYYDYCKVKERYFSSRSILARMVCRLL